MRRVGECEDGRSIGAVGRKRLERGFLKVRVGAEQRAQLRPSRRVPGIRGDIRGGSPDPVRRKAGERRELAEAGFDIARAQILVGEEIARGERARVAMLRTRLGLGGGDKFAYNDPHAPDATALLGAFIRQSMQ